MLIDFLYLLYFITATTENGYFWTNSINTAAVLVICVLDWDRDRANQPTPSHVTTWRARGQMGKRHLYVLMESWCQVSQPIGSKGSFIEDGGTLACLSVWGGATTSDSPDVGEVSLGKLRSSSATQEKLQYPLGTSDAVLPADGSPANTANPRLTFRAHKTIIKTERHSVQ